MANRCAKIAGDFAKPKGYPMIPILIDLKTAPETQLLPIHDFWNARRAEILPEDPPIPWQERLRNWREPSKHEHSRTFVLYEGQQLAGFAQAEWHDDDTDNPDIAWMGLGVKSTLQRQGYGSRLLLALLEEIEPLGRKKLFTSTMSLRPGGKPFAEYIGAKFGQEEHTNQLLFADLNCAYLKKSLENAPRDLYELVWYQNNLPEDTDELQRICDAFNVMNTAPRGELEINDFQDTPEKLRDWYEDIAKQETQWMLCLAKHKETGMYAGFTQTGWHHNRPKIGQQWGTGVDPAHRGHGLGAWLKSAMLERIMQQRPTVDRIRTGNADSNAPMLKINHALGFMPFLDRTEWQIDVMRSLEVLRRRIKVEGKSSFSPSPFG
jgi:mycothiol synthase